MDTSTNSNISSKPERHYKEGHWLIGDFLNLPGDEQQQILHYFASHYNMSEFDTSQSNKKVDSVFHTIGQIMTFICAAAGAYIIPETIVDFLKWPSSIATYWGLFNYVCVGAYVMNSIIPKK